MYLQNGKAPQRITATEPQGENNNCPHYSTDSLTWKYRDALHEVLLRNGMYSMGYQFTTELAAEGSLPVEPRCLLLMSQHFQSMRTPFCIGVANAIRERALRKEVDDGTLH